MDRYIVTIWYKERDGTKMQTNWSEYGKEGLVNGVESVDWDIRKNGATTGTIERVLPSGGTTEVYRRTQDVAPLT